LFSYLFRLFFFVFGGKVVFFVFVPVSAENDVVFFGRKQKVIFGRPLI